MHRKKTAATVSVAPDQHSMLRLLSQETKVPLSEYVREGIALVLEKYRHRLPGQLLLLQDETSRETKKSTLH